MKQKDKKLSLQIDVTATPKTPKGNIFAQTVCDYPLAEAISQKIVKHPVIPDGASQSKLQEKQSYKFTEKYKDYIDLGYIEWQKQYKENIRRNKKSLLFLMIDETKNCDEVGEYLEKTYTALKDAVLVIHTNNKGDISEAKSKKAKEKLEKLRRQANEIDSLKSSYKAIVSVMMLKEGWDVKNVTTIVGLRAFSSKSNILAEQALGRGLRKMFPNENEKVSVIGNSNFMDFIKSIEKEGVILEKTTMGSSPKTISIQTISTKKDEGLDIEYPIIESRLMRESKSLENIDIEKIEFKKFDIKEYSKEKQKEIRFIKAITKKEEEETSHQTIFEGVNIEPTQMISWFVSEICLDLRLRAEQHILYGKMKKFIKDKVFKEKIDLTDPNIIRNFSRNEITHQIFDTFKKTINNLIVKDIGDLKIKKWMKLSKVNKFSIKPTESQKIIITKKSIFDRAILDNGLEADFVLKLEGFRDLISHAKNYFEINHTFGVNFNIQYKKVDGGISSYYPDFFVKTDSRKIYIVETKGYGDENTKNKMEALKKWCIDINKIQNKYKYGFIYVGNETFNEYRDKLNNFEEVIDLFRDYQ